MGKRYFCDYCDRSFQDNLHNRKKHLNGLQHLKAKKLWYDMFRGGCCRPGGWADEALFSSLSYIIRQGNAAGQRQCWSGLFEEQKRGGLGCWPLGQMGPQKGRWKASSFPCNPD